MNRATSDIEKQPFEHDGYGDAVKQMGENEQALDSADLSRFAPPLRPKA